MRIHKETTGRDGTSVCVRTRLLPIKKGIQQIFLIKVNFRQNQGCQYRILLFIEKYYTI